MHIINIFIEDNIKIYLTQTVRKRWVVFFWPIIGFNLRFFFLKVEM
jgi:hypothetical protein